MSKPKEWKDGDVLDPALENTKEVLDKLENENLVSEQERKKTI